MLDASVSARAATIDMNIEKARTAEREAYHHWRHCEEVLKRLEESRAVTLQAVRRQLDPHNRQVASREAVKQLGTFVLSELQAKLGLSKGQTKSDLDQLIAAGIVEQVGKLGSRPMYRWVKPANPGEAFEAQRRHLALVDDPITQGVAQAIAGTGHDSVMARVGDKDVRKVVEEAILNGWRLEPAGHMHCKLVKGKAIVGVPSTPRNGGNAAQIVKQKLRRAQP